MFPVAVLPFSSGLVCSRLLGDLAVSATVTYYFAESPDGHRDNQRAHFGDGLCDPGGDYSNDLDDNERDDDHDDAD